MLYDYTKRNGNHTSSLILDHLDLEHARTKTAFSFFPLKFVKALVEMFEDGYTNRNNRDNYITSLACFH